MIAGDALLTRAHDDQVLTMIPHNRQQYDRDRARILAVGGFVLPGHDGAFLVSDSATAQAPPLPGKVTEEE